MESVHVKLEESIARGWQGKTGAVSPTSTAISQNSDAEQISAEGEDGRL